MSNDLTCVPAQSKAILQNRDVLAVNQDILGRMPFRFRVDNDTDVQLWRKELIGGDVAVAIANMHDNLTVPSGFQFDFRAVGFSPDTHVAVRNLYTGQDLGWQRALLQVRHQFHRMVCSYFVYHTCLLHMRLMYTWRSEVYL